MGEKDSVREKNPFQPIGRGFAVTDTLVILLRQVFFLGTV